MKVEFVKGNVVITIPVTDETIKAAPESKSGKSKMLASTGGFVPVEGAPAGVKLSLNLIGPK